MDQCSSSTPLATCKTKPDAEDRTKALVKRYDVAVIILRDITPLLPLTYGSHAALWLEQNFNSPTPLEPWLYDPAGSYTPPGSPQTPRGSGDLFMGDDASLDKYTQYHQDYSKIITYHFKLTENQARTIAANIERQGGARPFYCTIFVSSAIQGIGPFRNLKIQSLPQSLQAELEKIQRNR